MLERRPAAAGDEGFLRALHATTRPEVAALGVEERDPFLDLQFRAQQQAYEARFPGSAHELVLLDGHALGRVWVAWRPDECRIVDLVLLPEHRRSGIGTRIVGEILAEADRRDLCTRLTVERTNAPALGFWASLGFTVVADDPVYLALERPVTGPRPPEPPG